MEEKVKNLVVVGVNFKKTALHVRGRFAFTSDKIKEIYRLKEYSKVDDFFILSTCNRTEIYGITESPEKLKQIFTLYSEVTEAELDEHAFSKTGDNAMKHLFRVAAGIESQILGDYEIVGQLRSSFSLSKEHSCTSGYLEKLVNTSVQASREVRNCTSISNGTTSISYAVIQLLKLHSPICTMPNICLMGLGKIGALTLKNLKYYLPDRSITLVNRNEQRAETLATQYKVAYAKFRDQTNILRSSQVLIVATGADHPIISRDDIESSPIRVVFDLSVPSNVSAEVRDIPNVEFYDIDILSAMVNQTMSDRENQIPVAELIIDEFLDEFREWEKRRLLYQAKAGQ